MNGMAGLRPESGSVRAARRTEVHKFGGTSVAEASRLLTAAERVLQAAGGARVVVVSSALADVTNLLVEAAAAAECGDAARALEVADEVRLRHERVLAELGGRGEGPVLEEVRGLSASLAAWLRSVAALGELTPRTRDRILSVGEKLAVRLFALALHLRGQPGVPLDADDFLETDDCFGEAGPLPGVTDSVARAALGRYLERGEIPVVTGFVGCAPDGSTTTLGRGGSDLTATVLAAALGADEVTIWTDVDGVFTADPRTVPGARSIAQLNYREATELSFYGAKVLHPSTILPVAANGIPVRIRDSFTAAEGTVVDGRFTPGSHPVKAVSAAVGHALVSVEGKGMAGVPGVAARVFGALARRGISVTMISQSSSEASITLMVPERDGLEAELALKREFRADISHGQVDEVAVRPGVGVVAVVGLGMAHSPGVAARVLAPLGRRGINVLAIAQGSSELNISLAMDAGEVPEAVRALHDAFGLHRLDTGDDGGDRIDLLLLGPGKVGCALIELLLERSAHLFRRYGLRPRVVAVADRGGYLLHPGGISPEALRAVVESKGAGYPLTALEGAVPRPAAAMVHDALRYRLARPVLVDTSAAPDSGEVFREALRLGCDVVTANKAPLAGPLEGFHALLEDAEAQGRILRAEATVGAGLPVVDTLEMLLATGDRLLEVEGCLSGTLGYLLTRVEEGAPFSAAVEEAMRLGYTEPDPVTDLSGADVAHKALILGRLSGLVRTDVPLRYTGLVDPSLAGMEPGVLLARLREYDAPLAARVERARREGRVLRYLARVGPDSLQVGLTEVPADSPPGALRGTDNLVLFRSERYSARPLVVTGPGAGVEVTVMGVLADIMRIAAEWRTV
ncbi:MAG TPA: aspartate kinase [Longimicrobiaceae bacterium]|nr:aspartate kinase [Longimicrobiaceae bacterium]